MNHLKRLWEHSNKKPGVARLEKRYRKLFLYFLDSAEPTIGKLRLKHLSVLLNALISQRWMDADRRRYTSKLCQDAVQQVALEGKERVRARYHNIHLAWCISHHTNSSRRFTVRNHALR